jgi:hypothetical protein
LIEDANTLSPALGVILSIAGAISGVAGGIIFKIYKDKETQTQQYNSAVLDLNRQLITSVSDLKLELIRLNDVLSDLQRAVGRLDDTATNKLELISKDLEQVVISCEHLVDIPTRKRGTPRAAS